MLGFKSFESASRALLGIEIVRMIKKDQGGQPPVVHLEYEYHAALLIVSAELYYVRPRDLFSAACLTEILEYQQD
ncbi:hypothetical protein [Segetibacter koreensis]|uniref:hypothetical protein n=1 Tax=Segetibacter koreensis TaxID=398037 RepID=UPI001B7FB9F2|nr:hypothetical protein [Segetibacter koreensis]